jgi:pimeloyl-ACP methyl ester carboxylesterase
MIHEEAVHFGEDGGLSGILTLPATAGGGLGVLILNAGIVQRAGPNRLHVTLARQLATQGIACFRFDFSGIGDSEPRPGGPGYAERVVEEAALAMDVLGGRAGARRVALVGICSGADNALRIAAADDRVAAAVLIEGYAWDTLAYHVSVLARRALRGRTWTRLLRGRISWRGVWQRLVDARPRVDPGPADEVTTDILRRPDPRQMAADLCAAGGRGQGLLLVYSRDGISYHNFRRFFRRRIARVRATGQVAVEVVDGTNHTFSPLPAQRRVVAVIGEWLASRAGSAGA